MSVKPNDRNIDDIFGNRKYFIDFYQRDYKWKKEHVQSLLDDIIFKFHNEYSDTIDPTIASIQKFGWYYLNTFVTNNYNGKPFIVDGQQRFTTLTLILIKLYHMAIQFDLDNEKQVIQRKIFAVDIGGISYWMGADEREAVLGFLVRPEGNPYNGLRNISIDNILANYNYIDTYFENVFQTEHKFKTFLIFFLKRILLVEISIDDFKDVPMVFEVINDRGEKLKPYEVFKGELLGQLDKDEIDTYYKIWMENVHALQTIDEKHVDNFFRFLFRSKHVDSRTDYRDFDREYHKAVFSNKWEEVFRLKRNPIGVKDFVTNEFNYFAQVYRLLLEKTNEEKTALYFNDLNDLDRQYLLLLSALKTGDSNQDEKIDLVAKLFDKHFSILQLMGCYDSNDFTDSIISLNTSIRERTIEEIQERFNNQLREDIYNAKNTKVDDPFQSYLFREAGNSLGKRFIRYFFARIDHFLAINLQAPVDNYYNLVVNRGSVYGYHIEHILAVNNENIDKFENEELFMKERNRLGALSLLNNRINLSSNNEPYEEKLKTYSNGTLWLRTLTKDFYHKNPHINDLNKRYGLNFRHMPEYGPNEIEERQALLFDIAKIIWQ